MNYKDQYIHPKWQKKRLEILERDGFSCMCCGEENKQLHVHHKYYIAGKNIWDYPNDSLITLCCDCHKIESQNIDKSCELLLMAFKEKFSSFEIRDFACYLHSSYFKYPQEVVSSAFSFLLENTDNRIMKPYFKHIRIVNKNSKKKKEIK